MAERKEWWEILRDQLASRGLLDPESERIQEAVSATPAVQRQARGLLSLDPQAESDTVLEMGLGSLPGTGQLMALRDLERARRAKDPGAAAMAASNFIPFGTLLNRFRRGPMSELDVYHGTPHRFDPTEENPLGEFDASKIGTGEGAQAYGHGIYYAESPTVAQGYKTANELTNTLIDGKQVDFADPRYQAAVRISTQGYKKALDTAIKEAESNFLTAEGKAKRLELAEQIKALRGRKVGSETTGSLYKADLPDQMIDRMLDWDKPLSEQSYILKSISKNKDFVQYAERIMERPLSELDGKTLERIAVGYAVDKGAKGSQNAAKLLKEAGIPGIRYLDAGSRDGGSGTRNFVVFPGEEKKVKILERK